MANNHKSGKGGTHAHMKVCQCDRIQSGDNKSFSGDWNGVEICGSYYCKEMNVWGILIFKYIRICGGAAKGQEFYTEIQDILGVLLTQH